MKSKRLSVIYDVVVLGGGPAGMTAALFAALHSDKVLIIEKNHILGVKLRRTGGGRCNITNNTPVVRELLSVYKDAGKFLFSPFAKFDVPQTRVWLESIGVPTVEEAERRVFPVSQSAEQVTEALIAELKRRGVTIYTDTMVQGITKDGQDFVVKTNTGVVQARRVIVSTGGLSRPETGATGDALPWLQVLGHTIETPRSSLVPLAVKESAVTARLGGVSLREAGISIWAGKTLLSKSKGKILFTHTGLSGPGILNQSAIVGSALAESKLVTITLDVIPQYTIHDFGDILLDRLMTSPNKLLRNQFTDLIPTSLVVPILDQAGVLDTTASHSVTVAERRAVVSACKALRFTVTRLLGSDKAIVSSGGVSLPEVDFRTMESRIVPGLYLIGDVLNIDRPTGGYSLQLCWTTGMVAGEAAVL